MERRATVRTRVLGRAVEHAFASAFATRPLATIGRVISRYLDPAVERIWSDANRYELWREVEVSVVAAYVAEEWFSPAVLEEVSAAPTPTVAEISESEATTKHDVGAFLQCWTRHMSDAAASRVHRGLTSSDLVDTALALQIGATSAMIEQECALLRDTLRDHALDHLGVARVGRTHGQFAAPDSWGHRVADFAFAVDRSLDRLRSARRETGVGKLSGPVGTNEQIPVEVEVHALDALGLERSPVVTQVVSRDRVAAWIFALSLVVTVCEAVAVELRLSQMSDVAETREGVAPHQVGSSSMPHKRNPITAEQICGLARVVRGYVNPVMEGIPLWFQRDISHSSVERICLPDASALTVHVVRATRRLIVNLDVDVERMRHNLRSAGASVRSHADTTALMDGGMPYTLAHRRVMETVPDESGADVTLDDGSSATSMDLLRGALQRLG